jgi:SOS-response transcriptional repressor LexA
MSRRSSRQPFTEKQGEYLAFIYVYSHMFQRSPAETDMQRYFRVSPPSVQQMVVTLERTGLIRRQPGVPRSIEILVPRNNFPSSDGSKSTRQILCDELLGRCRYRGSDQPYRRAAARMSRPIAKPAPTANSRGAPAAIRTTRATAPASAAEA